MNTPWWKETTIYQIYPISFFDSNADGIGDIQGIIQKLDYIKDLGFETIWVSPFYKSPMRDYGYDISDYLSIHANFGTLEDAFSLIKEVHDRNMKIVFDMVMNHTSDQHEWFQKSRENKNSEKRDWYIWKPGKGKKSPNNWYSMIGKPGWNYDLKTDEWYYASFLDFQPDLNYHNPEVKKAMFDIIRYWLHKGVDGFRLDIFNCIIKDKHFRDNPFRLRYIPTPEDPDGFFQTKRYNMNTQGNFDFAKELRSVIDEFSPTRFLLGEVFGKSHIIKKFLGKNHDGLNLIFLFNTIEFNFTAKFFKKMIATFEEAYPEPFVPVYAFGNHDQKRFISKLGNSIEKAKIIALIQYTVRGVPVTYYGEETGMQEAEIPFHKAKDPLAQNYKHIPKFLTDLLGIYINRDGCRTPMQWNSTKHAGFSEAKETWMDINKNYHRINVETEQQKPNSLWNSYKILLRLRNEANAFKKGILDLIEIHKDVLCYIRKYENEQYTILCNFSKKQIFIETINLESIVYSTYGDNGLDKQLRAFEGVLLKTQ